MIRSLAAAAAVTLAASVAVAQETPAPPATPAATVTPAGTGTPSTAATPTPAPTAPGLCAAAAACVSGAVPPAVASCLAADAACKEPAERFALTAADVAVRAIAAQRCDRPAVKRTRARCSACYHAAKAPLRARFKFDLFRGLLGRAAGLIDEERKVVCGSVAPKAPAPAGDDAAKEAPKDGEGRGRGRGRGKR